MAEGAGYGRVFGETVGGDRAGLDSIRVPAHDAADVSHRGVATGGRA